MPELDEEIDLDSGDEVDASVDDSASGESKADNPAESPDKRVRDLQSKFDQETARANKAEKRIAALKIALKGSNSDGGKPTPNRASESSTDPAVLEMAQMFAYQQHPALAEYGVEMSDITGSTPGEIARNAAALLARFEKVATIARNKALADQGIAPEISADRTTKQPRDFSKMPKEDFEKIVQEALTGQRS